MGDRPAQPPTEERRQMPTYIMLSTLTPEGVQTVKNNPQRIKEVNKEVEQLGASVKAQWATLGHVDFISVIEAPDEQTIARVPSSWARAAQRVTRTSPRIRGGASSARSSG